MFLDQSQNTADTGSEQTLAAGRYAKNTLLAERANFSTIIHNLRLDHDLGFATLTATANYHKKRQSTTSDLTNYFGALLGGLAAPVAGPQSAYSKGTTFEVRLASPSGRRFEYLIGAYYDRTTENFIDDFTAPIPPTFKSDSLINYELGARADLFDRKLQLDGTVYYVDWSDIQLRLGTSTGLAYAANAGKARNYGFEGTATLRPTTGLTIQANVTYLNAKLSRAFDPGAGQPIIPKGTTLPGASKWQVSDSVGYQWRKSPLRPSVTLLHRYVSSASSSLTFGGRQGGYNIFDLRTGLQVRNMTLSAFVQNIGDTRGVTNASAYPGTPYAQYLIRPRVLGMTVDVKF